MFAWQRYVARRKLPLYIYDDIILASLVYLTIQTNDANVKPTFDSRDSPFVSYFFVGALMVAQSTVAMVGNLFYFFKCERY